MKRSLRNQLNFYLNRVYARKVADLKGQPGDVETRALDATKDLFLAQVVEDWPEDRLSYFAIWAHEQGHAIELVRKAKR